MSNFFFFTGENAYAIRAEKKRWMDEFGQKHGQENMLKLQGKDVTLRSLLDEVSVAPFLAERRLVIVEGVPKLAKEEVPVLVQNLHPQTILLITDPAPDKRLGGTKALLEAAETKVFAPLEGKALEEWAIKQAASHGSSLDHAAFMALTAEVGEDQNFLEQEIAKLAMYAGKKGITREDVDTLAVPFIEGVVWKISDLVSGGRNSDALRYARRILARGGDAYGVWAILLNMLRNATAVAASLKDGTSDPKDMAQELGIHPFALRSIIPFARRAGIERLKPLVQRTADEDIALKTGGYRSTDEWPQEILALVDKFILRCP